MCDLAQWTQRWLPMQQSRVRILHAVFLKFIVFPDFSGKWTVKFQQLLEMYSTGILQSIYCKNGTRKKSSIYSYLLHCYPTVYLPELSGKLKTVKDLYSRECYLEDGINLIQFFAALAFAFCAPGLYEERTRMNRIPATWWNGCFKKGLIHTTPNQHPAQPPKRDALRKNVLQIILAAKWLVPQSISSPKQQRRPQSSLVYLSFFYSFVYNTVYIIGICFVEPLPVSLCFQCGSVLQGGAHSRVWSAVAVVSAHPRVGPAVGAAGVAAGVAVVLCVPRAVRLQPQQLRMEINIHSTFLSMSGLGCPTVLRLGGSRFAPAYGETATKIMYVYQGFSAVLLSSASIVYCTVGRVSSSATKMSSAKYFQDTLVHNTQYYTVHIHPKCPVRLSIISFNQQRQYKSLFFF